MKPYVLAATTLACIGVAAIGVRITTPSIRSPWYQSLEKPTWQPPNKAFGPVWTTLYALIAVSGAIVWSNPGKRVKVPRALWVLQLSLNFLWTAVFFGKQSLLGGVVTVCALWLSILGYIVMAARRASRVAALLFLPYLLWVTIAAALNVWIELHNRRA